MLVGIGTQLKRKTAILSFIINLPLILSLIIPWSPMCVWVCAVPPGYSRMRRMCGGSHFESPDEFAPAVTCFAYTIHRFGICEWRHHVVVFHRKYSALLLLLGNVASVCRACCFRALVELILYEREQGIHCICHVFHESLSKCSTEFQVIAPLLDVLGCYCVDDVP